MKLPHWAQLALGLAHVIIIWVIAHASPTDLSLPAIAVTVLVAADKAIALFTDSVPTALAARRARLAAVRSMQLLAFAASFAFLVFAFGCQGCTKEQGQTIIPPIVDVSTCIIRTIADDVAAGKTWAQASDDAIAQCLLGHVPTSDAERAKYAPIVEREWSAVEGADAKRGLVPRPIAGRHTLILPAPAPSAP